MSTDKLSGLRSHLATRAEITVTVLQAMLLGIPHIGASLEKLIFGTSQEARMKRIERTLIEVAEQLETLGQTQGVEKEEFAELFEAVAPSIGRASAEQKRVWFRDLLVNAAKTPSGASEWEEAALAAELIKSVSAPGLEILAKLSQREYSEGEVAISLDDRPMIYRWPKDALSGSNGSPLSFDRAVTEEWIRRLDGGKGMGLICCCYPIHRRRTDGTMQTVHGRDEVSLTTLGRLLVRWGSDATETGAT